MISGGQQALDFTAKCLLNDGDTVLTEAPTFLNALNTFRTYGARIVGVPMDGEAVRRGTNLNQMMLYILNRGTQESNLISPRSFS